MKRSLAAAVLAVLLTGGPATACNFCCRTQAPLRVEAASANLILFGTLANATGDAQNGGTVDIHIEQVIKSDFMLDGARVLELPRYVEVDPKKPQKYIVLCDVHNGKLDPYRGILVKTDALADYLAGALMLDVKDKTAARRHALRYLEHADEEVAREAFREFSWDIPSPNDFRDLARDLPAEKLVRWLKNPKTAAHRIDTYAAMLGHCGNDDHAALLLRLLKDEAEWERSRNGFGALIGYTLLRPKDGREQIRRIAKDEKREFVVRYAALQAVRFFWEDRPDVVKRPELLDAVRVLLDQGDIADLAVEDLRRWKQWDETGRVLALFGKASHDIPIMRRSILRFALKCPTPEAARFVAEQRRTNAQQVADLEELLKLEEEQDEATPKK